MPTGMLVLEEIRLIFAWCHEVCTVSIFRVCSNVMALCSVGFRIMILYLILLIGWLVSDPGGIWVCRRGVGGGDGDR